MPKKSLEHMAALVREGLKEKSEIQGSIKQLNGQLKKQGYASLKVAKKALAKKLEQVAALDTKIEEGTKQLQASYDW